MMGGGSPQTTTQQQQQTSQPWAPAVPELTNLLGSVSSLPTSLTPGQTSALSSLTSSANSIPNMGPSGLGVVNNLEGSTNGTNQAGMWNDAYSNLMKTLAPYYNPGYTDPMSVPGFSTALNTMNTDITNQVKDMYSASGRDPTGAGSFAQSLGRGLSQGEGGLIANEFNQLVGQQQGAASMGYGAGAGTAQGTTGLLQTPLMNQIAGLQASGQLPGLYMAPASAQVGAANALYSQPFQNIQYPESLTVPIAGLGGQTQGSGTQQTTPAFNPWSTAAGIGAGLFAMSDERTKENIEPVGLLYNGLNVYRYNFKGDSRPQIGVIAQEVEKVKPEAVAEIGGIKHVRYDLATEPGLWKQAA